MAKLRVGDMAPDFKRPWTGEGEFSLSERRGRWLVLAFYPGDETPTCTRQLCEYSANRETFEDLDAEVIGISPQGIESHEAFIANHGLAVPLVADQGLEVAEAYGIRIGPTLRRALFIVDPGGRVAHRDVKLVGLGYTDSEAIAKALTEARAVAAG
jgi:peroxiredoxin Q/BCP